MKGAPEVGDFKDIDRILFELSRKFEQTKDDLTQNEKSEETLTAAIEQREKDVKEAKSKQVEKSKLLKLTGDELKMAKKLGEESVKEMRFKTEEMEKLKRNVTELTEEENKLADVKEAASETLVECRRKWEEIKDQQKIIEEGFSFELNKMAEIHATKSREAAEKRADLQHKLVDVKRLIFMEDVEIRTFAAKNKMGKKKKTSDPVTNVKDEIVEKKKRLDEKTNELQKLETELRSMTPTVKSWVGPSPTEPRQPGAASVVKRSLQGDSKVVSGGKATGVFDVDSSSESEMSAKYPALARSPFVTPRQSRRLGEAGPVTPQTRAVLPPRLADSRARSGLSLQRKAWSKAKVWSNFDQVMGLSDSCLDSD